MAHRLAWVELHGQQHGPDRGPAEGGHRPSHPQQPHVLGSHRHLGAPLAPGGGLRLRLHHVLLHGSPAAAPRAVGEGRGGGAGRRLTTHAPQFYHACDQPGEAVLCILGYDTLQYCDFLGSGVSIWVTILCMARLKAAQKHVSDSRCLGLGSGAAEALACGLLGERPGRGRGSQRPALSCNDHSSSGRRCLQLGVGVLAAWRVPGEKGGGQG